MIQKLTTAILSVLFCISFSGCTNGNVTDTETKEKQQPVDNAFLEEIETAQAGLSFQHEELVLSGKVEYDPDKVIHYMPLLSGVAERTYFSLGDKVHKGQGMLDIRSAELSSLQSEQSLVESDLRLAERELQTAQSLFEDRMLSERELFEAEAKVKQARADLNKIKTDMAVFGTNKSNGVFSIKAPMSGYVVAKNVSSGSTVSSGGETLFTIADLSSVWITVNIYAGNLLFVKEGMPVEITTLSYPDEIFQGNITTISQVFDPEEKVLKARIVMSNKDMKFKPEMSVMVNLKNETPQKMVSVPSEALLFDNNNYFVVVENTDNKFEVREVLPQGHHQNTTYLAFGLTEEEKVVVKNQLLIYSALKN